MYQPPMIVMPPAAPPPVYKDVGIAYGLWLFFGPWGVHRFYIGDVALGMLFLLTCGLFGLGWIIDGFFLAGAVRSYNEHAAAEAQYAQQQAMHAMQQQIAWQQQQAAWYAQQNRGPGQ